jgi:hypothetical protein
MPAFSDANISNTLKTIWVNRVEVETARVSPALALIKKNTGWVGDALTTVIPYGHGAGRSADITKAIAASANSKNAKFTHYSAHNYAVFTVDNEALLASKNDSGAVVKHLYRESQGKHEVIMTDLAQDLYRNGDGAKGRRASASTNVITLTNPDDSVNFNIGDAVIAATATTGGTLRSGSTTVASVDYDNGTVTLTSAAGITSFADNDYLFVDGDRGAKLYGFDAWIPATVSATTFGGVDRSVNPYLLAGVRYDGSNGLVRDAISGGISRCGRVKGKPSHAFLSYEYFDALQMEMDNKRNFVDVMARNVEINFRGIEFNAPNGGSVIVLPDTHAPGRTASAGGVCFGIKVDNWTIHSREGLPHLKDADGLTMVRNTSNADNYQGQWIYYAQLNPSEGRLQDNFRAALPPL